MSPDAADRVRAIPSIRDTIRDDKARLQYSDSPQSQ
jgi:hypothetical protein